jgi:hypothetical protein
MMSIGASSVFEEFVTPNLPQNAAAGKESFGAARRTRCATSRPALGFESRKI